MCTAGAKRISGHAWEELRSRVKGGPELAPADTCPTCLSDLLTGIAAKEDVQDLRERYVAMAAVLLEQGAMKAEQSEGEARGDGGGG